MKSSFQAIDWAVLAIYAVGMLGIGWYFSRRAGTTDEFLLGGRKMKPWAVGLSYFASLTSTISYLMYPGEMIKNGPMILGSLAAYPLAYLVVSWLLLPKIMSSKGTSAYETLETRFGLSVRMLGSTFFMLMRLVWMAMIIYATSTSVLVPLLRLEPAQAPWVCVALGTITVIYTSMGGLQAVIWTDVVQTLIMMGGAMLSIAVVTSDVGGFSAWWPTTWSPQWEQLHWVDAPGTRLSILSILTYSLTMQVCVAASDQIAVQRYLATENVRAARRMFGIALLADFFVMLLLAALGLSLLAFFQMHPALLPPGKTVTTGADQLLPHFIATSLPAGISGLVIAGLLSAAMGSLSSGLSSSCSVVTVDWIDRFRLVNPRTDRVRTAKVVSWTIGLVVIGISFIFNRFATGNLLDQAYKYVNLLAAPLAVLFFMAMFVPWATAIGAWAAALASVVVAVGIGHFDLFGVSFLWLAPASLLAGMLVGCVVSLLPIGRRRAMLEVDAAA